MKSTSIDYLREYRSEWHGGLTVTQTETQMPKWCGILYYIFNYFVSQKFFL